MDFAVHGILQARTLEWVAVPFSRGSFRPRDRAQVSCITGGFFTSSATREAINTGNQSTNEEPDKYIHPIHCVCAWSLSCVWLFATPWTTAHQTPLSLGLPRQEHWSGCHFLLQGIFPPRDRTCISGVCCIAGGFFTCWDTGEAHTIYCATIKKNEKTFLYIFQEGKW